MIKINLLLKKYLAADRLYYFLLSAFAAVLPFSEDWSYNIMFLTLIIWMIKFFKGETKFIKSPLSTSIALLILSILISFVINIKMMLAHGIVNHIQQLLSFTSPLLWFFIISSMPITEKKVKIILQIYLASSLSIIIYLLILYFKIPYSINNRLTFHDQSNAYACLIAIICSMLFVFVFLEKNKFKTTLSIFFLIIALISLMFTYSRGAWIGLIAGLLGASFFLRKKSILLIWAIILLILIISVFVGHDFFNRIQSIFMMGYSSNASRLDIWNTAFKMIPYSPLFGIGQHMFPVYFAELNPQHWRLEHIPHAHNNFMDFTIEEGFIGLFIFLIFNIFIFIKALQLKNFAPNQFRRGLAIILIAWLFQWNVHGMVDNTYLVIRFTVMIMFLLALLISLENSKSLED